MTYKTLDFEIIKNDTNINNIVEKLKQTNVNEFMIKFKDFDVYKKTIKKIIKTISDENFDYELSSCELWLKVFKE